MENKNYKVIWRDDANNDLRRIRRYIATQMFKPIAAVKTVKNIEDSANKMLSFSPYLPLVNNKRLAKLGYRRMIVKNHIVVFIFNEGDTTVSIVRIFHSRQNWRRILAKYAQ